MSAEENQKFQYAVIFPGQGSQSVGMLNGWGSSPTAGARLQEASDVLGYDMQSLIADDDEEKLGQTAFTQPALLTSGLIAWDEFQLAIQKSGTEIPSASFLAGHSLGEYTALVAAGVLSFADALELVQFRGTAMQDAVPEGQGGMAAILGLDDDKVLEACELASAEGVVAAVNFNSPGQVVIAGERGAVNTASNIAKDMGAKRVLPLPVSVPSHCVLMKPASERLAERMRDIQFSKPSIPVVQNADVAAFTDAHDIQEALIKQLYSPVRWVESMQYIAAQGVTQLFECGPGRVLFGLQRRINREVKALPIFDVESLEKAMSVFENE